MREGASANLPRSHPIWLWVLFLGVLLVHVVYFLNTSVLGLDDAYIYYRVASNLLRGAGAVFNEGDARFVVSSPLWLFLVSAARMSVPGASIPVLAYTLYLACAIASCFALRALLEPCDRLAAALAPAVVFAANPTARCVGMETTLSFGLGIALLVAFSRNALLWAGLLAGLLYLARPEGLLLVALVSGFHVFRGGLDARSIGRQVRRSLPAAAVFASICLAWHAWFLLEFSTFFPATLSVKVLQGESGKWTLFHAELGAQLAGFVATSWVLVPLAGIGLVRLARELPLLLAWPVAHGVALSLLRVPHYHWYYATMGYVLLVAVLLGAAKLVRWTAGLARAASATPLGARAAVAAALVAAVGLGWAAWGGIRLESLDPRRLPDLETPLEERWELRHPRLAVYRRAAAWLDANRADGEHPVVLTDEVGILGFYLPDHEVRDPVGIATPGLRPEDLFRRRLVVRRYEPEYLVLGGWGLRPDALQPGLAFRGTPIRYQAVADFEDRGGFHARIYARANGI